jgi:uncharacterized protein with HEPN domain
MDSDAGSILDIVIACRRLKRFVEGRSRKDLDGDELFQYAVLHATALIGEAASRLSLESRQGHADIPWGDIIGTRNRIIHGYDQVKLDIVWAIATEKIVLLLENLEPLVPPPPESNT